MLDTRQVTAVAQLLSSHIGPPANILVRRAQVNYSNRAELCEAMAQHIENKHDRETFLAAFRQAP